MSLLLSLDPSIRSSGVALFRDGLLVRSARISSEEPAPRGLRVVAMARAIVEWGCPGAGWPDVLVYEWPQVYRASKSRGDPNDLLLLAAVVGGVSALCRVDEILTPTPREWSGGLPKVTKGNPWLSARGARVASRLSAEELALVPRSHDAIDAVGIGLWALGRFAPRRVLPGAT